MLRFLAILIIAYFIIKFLRGLFQTNVIVKNYHYNGENPNTKAKDEGDVKISGGEGSNSHKSDDMGEYVDYEEIKD
jgi:hypothetical protein